MCQLLLSQNMHEETHPDEKNLQVQRFPPLVRASIGVAMSVIRIGERKMIGLGRAARVALSGRPCLSFSAADANHLFSLSPGNIYVNLTFILPQTHSK